MADTQLFMPFEDLHYSLSMINHGIDDDGVFASRMSYFAEFVESLVLSDFIILEDSPSEDENLVKADKEAFGILEELGIRQQFVVKKMKGVGVTEHAPNAIAQFVKPSYISTDPDIFPELDETALLEFLSHDAPLNSFQKDHFTHLEDFMRFYTQKYDLLNPEEWRFLKEIVKIAVRVEKTGNPVDRQREIQKMIDYFTETDLSRIDITKFGLPKVVDFSQLDPSELAQLDLSPTLPNHDYFEKMILMYFWGIHDSVVSMVLREGLVWQPMPLRANFLLNTPVFSRTDKSMLSKLNNAATQKIFEQYDLIYENYSQNIPFPILFNYILSQSHSIRDVFEIALELKFSKELRRYKSWCNELDQCLRYGMIKDANKLIADARNFINRITNPKINDARFSLQISFPPSISFEIPVGSPGKRENQLIFLKNIYEGASTPESLHGKVKKLFRRF